jgi:Protein of unknown function (DUF3048) N-terminal domain/Protein of unknown function (DUF3048) C-terminal domain
MARPNWLKRPLSAVLAVALLGAACGPNPSPSPSIEAISPSPTDEPSLTPLPTPSPEASASPSPPAILSIDGLTGDPAIFDRLPIAVMIDDNAVARPQAGFNAASIVYQAPADGGEDRYMLVFQEGDASLVGPVRSGRPYFVRWATEYRSLFAHFGGDAKTLAYIPTIDGSLVYNLDALAGSYAAFYRVSSRPAPHNAYTSTAAMWRVGEERGAPDAMIPGLPVRLFGTEAALDSRPTSGSITIPYGTGATSYRYDPTTDAYLRSVAGHAQYDAADGQRVTAMDVVVLFMALSIDPQSEPGHHRPVLAQIGTGKALVFNNGKVVVGTWSKASAGALTIFVDSSGAQIPLVPGRIFIQVVPSGATVSYAAVSG